MKGGYLLYHIIINRKIISTLETNILYKPCVLFILVYINASLNKNKTMINDKLMVTSCD